MKGDIMILEENFEIVIPQDNENKILGHLNKSYEKLSQMTAHEREFINALILRKNPKKPLEIGVSAGSSSIVILNAIKNRNNAKLFSIDYSNSWYKSPDKKTGFLVDDYIGLREKWVLYTGGLSLKFIDKIGGNIDFCLIDTLHINPGGILDFLMVLPYLKKDAVVIFHDIGWHTWNYPDSQWDITNSLLMSSVIGKKLIQGNFSKKDKNMKRKTYFQNIGGIQLNKDSHKHIYELINLLTLRWGYLPKEKEQKEMIIHFRNNYDGFYIKYLEEIFNYQKKCYKKKL
jgi:predicted O-methyltransferase YrrM